MRQICSTAWRGAVAANVGPTGLWMRIMIEYLKTIILQKLFFFI